MALGHKLIGWLHIAWSLGYFCLVCCMIYVCIGIESVFSFVYTGACWEVDGIVSLIVVLINTRP